MTTTASPHRRSESGRSGDTVGRRVARTTAGVIIVLLLVGGAVIYALVRSVETVNELSGGYGPASDANSAALIYMLDAETGIRGYALTGRRSSLDPYRRAVHKILPSVDSVAAALHGIDDRALDAAIARERRLARAWILSVANPSVANQSAAQRTTATTKAKSRFDAFRAANTKVSGSLDQSRARLRQETSDQRTVVLPIVIGGAVAALLLAGVIVLRTVRHISRPLGSVWQVVRRLEDGDLSARADETRGPAEVRELSAAINSLAVERRRALVAQRADDQLRRETRALTSAIRIGQDPHAIARTLVAGLGRVFDVDRVWLQTFDDPRVPVVAEQWIRGGGTRNTAAGPSAEGLRGVAGRLWHSTSVVGIADQTRLDETTDPHVRVTPQAAIARASAIAALGEGNTAFGLLWLGVVDVPREWTPAELGLLQHVAAEFAQNLVQSHVLVRQREAMRLLREADEAKSALVSTVSHELRTPLTSIMGYLDLLLDMYADDLPPQVPEMLRVIERNATRLRALIDDLLVQSQIEAGRRLVTLDRVDLTDVLADVVETINPLADAAGLDLTFDRPPAGQLLVDGDARQLGQAVSNLASNAIKFTPRGGLVTIAASRDGDDAVVRIRDTGIGIPAAEVPHLFDRFYRASNARSAVIPGTGLGLGIVAEIVAQHDGTVQVDSELGRGTTFVIRLPVVLPARPPERAPSPGTVEYG